MKQYVTATYAHNGSPLGYTLCFSYPADFQVDNIGEIRIRRLPPRGFSAWIEDHFKKGSKLQWDESGISIYFDSNPGKTLDELEYTERPWFGPNSNVRHIACHLGPAVVIDGTQLGNPIHAMCILPHAIPTGGTVRSTGAEVTILYIAPKTLESELQRVVDDLVSSMQVVSH